MEDNPGEVTAEAEEHYEEVSKQVCYSYKRCVVGIVAYIVSILTIWYMFYHYIPIYTI